MEKFKFDVEFSLDGTAKAPPRVKRSFRAEEVERLTAQARAEGERSAVAAAERQAARALDELAKGLHELLSSMRLALDGIHDDSTRLAASVGRKLAAQAFAAAPAEYFAQAVSECLDLARREPVIRITIPADSPTPLRDRLALLSAKHGLPDTLRIEESRALSGAECRIDWVSGGALISLEEACARMDALIEERIAALQATRPAMPERSRATS